MDDEAEWMAILKRVLATGGKYTRADVVRAVEIIDRQQAELAALRETIGELRNDQVRWLECQAELAALRVENERLKDVHCKDCCCARIWNALGITAPTGRYIWEEVDALRVQLREAQSEINRLELDRDKWQHLCKTAKVDELKTLVVDLRQRGSGSLLGFGGEDYLRRVINERINTLQRIEEAKG